MQLSGLGEHYLSIEMSLREHYLATKMPNAIRNRGSQSSPTIPSSPSYSYDDIWHSIIIEKILDKINNDLLGAGYRARIPYPMRKSTESLRVEGVGSLKQ